MNAGWLSQGFEPPKTTIMADGFLEKPVPKPLPTQLAPSMHGIRTDEDLSQFLTSSRPGTAVVEYGTAWCQKCHEMFPQFFKLTKQYPQHRYAVAQAETMQATVASIKYTPTFAFYRNGKKVDEVIGKEPQKLHDHLWLHSD